MAASHPNAAISGTFGDASDAVMPTSAYRLLKGFCMGLWRSTRAKGGRGFGRRLRRTNWNGAMAPPRRLSGYQETKNAALILRPFSSLRDPGCVKTCTEQKSLESYSHTPPVHDLFDTLYQKRMTCAARQKCGNYGVFEFSGVGHRWAS
jgi:hypothetical protein